MVREPEFAVVLSSWTISMLGSVVSQVALAVLVLDRSGSPLLSALTFALGFLPYAIGGSLLSAASDRYPTRRVMVLGDLAQAVLVAAMVLPGMPIWSLLVLVAVRGTIAPVYAGARAATLPEMLPAASFPLARALLRMVSMGAQVVGFGIGGALLVVLPARGLLALNAATFALSALLLRVGTRHRPARQGSGEHGMRSLAGDSWRGVRLVLGSPTVRPLLLLGWIPPLFAVVPEALAAPYVRRVGAPDSGLGLLLGAAALGSVLGAVVVGSLVSERGRERLILPLVLVQLVPLLVFAVQPSLHLAAALLLAVGLGTAYELGLDQRLLAALDPQDRGLALSVSSSGLMLTQGTGFALAGAAAELLPEPTVIAGAGAVGVLTLAVLARPLTRASAAGQRPARG